MIPLKDLQLPTSMGSKSPGVSVCDEVWTHFNFRVSWWSAFLPHRIILTASRSRSADYQRRTPCHAGHPLGRWCVRRSPQTQELQGLCAGCGGGAGLPVDTVHDGWVVWLWSQTTLVQCCKARVWERIAMCRTHVGFDCDWSRWTSQWRFARHQPPVMHHTTP